MGRRGQEGAQHLTRGRRYFQGTFSGTLSRCESVLSVSLFSLLTNKIDDLIELNLFHIHDRSTL